jgi:GNAT superfamily N-acetyltransferase
VRVDRPVSPELLAAHARPDVSLRLARAHEIPLASEIDDEALGLYAEHGVAFDVLAHAAFFAAEVRTWTDAAEHARVVFASDAAGVVGFAALGFLDGAPILEQLSVRRRAMRRGVGSTLVALAIDWSASSGALWLTTYDHLPFNRPFYERRGFVVVPERDCGPGLRALLDAERIALPRPDARVAMRLLHVSGAKGGN